MAITEPAEERLALFIDHENVAIGARDIGYRFDPAPLMEALAERGKLLVRKAYADWNLFSEDRRGMVDSNVELLEIPQRSDSVRKNAADIQMAVDALELAFTRDFVSTFVIVSGDSDFTPLVSKLRELNKRVIGVGLKGSTSAMLPPACDEFLFYDRLEGAPRRTPGSAPAGRAKKKGGTKKSSGKATTTPAPASEPKAEMTPDDAGQADKPAKASSQKQDLRKLERLIARTLSGIQSSADGAVQASNLKRALLRKDPTFNEQDYGFRGFRELLRHLEEQKVLVLTQGSAKGDPEVDFPSAPRDEDAAFQLLRTTVKELMDELGGDPPLSGLKDQLRKRQPDFSEKDLGYSGFLQFCKAAVNKDVVEMDWEEPDQEYYLYVEDDAPAS
ncbi:NYN domain-containing protein [Egicoccus halophilus]|nr:NYN domain-containing protein [Egicoccus halophilus]